MKTIVSLTSPRVCLVLVLAGILASPAGAQNLDALEPEPVPSQVEAPAPIPDEELSPMIDGDRIGILRGEEILLPKLAGVAFYDSAEKATHGTDGPGLSVHDIPLLDTPELQGILKFFLQGPASHEGLKRIASATRVYLAQIGYPFSLVYLPPQDITGGTVRYVVIVSRLGDEVQIKGAKYFSPELYQKNIRARAGEPFDARQLKADIDWINRNPFRAASATTVAGTERGTSQILLRVNEKFPWRFFMGANNTGTESTQEERFNAGFNWGNAFGLGHQLTAQWTSSWDFEALRSVSGSYEMDLPWRHTLSFSGAYSRTNGILAAPFALKGTSWQVAANYHIALQSNKVGFSHSLKFGVDFKSSDNNFTFADVPISNNLTHVAQGRASWSGNLGSPGRLSTFGASITGAPGGLTNRNKDRFFNLSRAGAKASYIYFRANASHTIQLFKIKPGLSWTIRAQTQISPSNLIGSEQFGGGGSTTVRGYEEGEVYKDNGFLISHELRLPAWQFSMRKASGGQLQAYVFQDFANLWSTDKLPGEKNVDLHSAGVGADLSFGSHASLRAAYGWQFTDSGSSDSGDNSRLHLSANLSF